MKTFLLSFLGGLTALVLFFLIIPVIIISAFSGGEDEGPQGSVVLAVDLRASYPDQRLTSGPAAIFGQVSFIDILTRLDAAADDPNVEGVFLRASEFGVGSARAEELRTAFLKLRAADKFVIAHSQGFLTGGPSNYRAVSSADEIWLQPGADFNVTGVAFETLFFKDLLDNIGVTSEIEALGEYKNAPNVYKETGYTDAHAETLQALGEGIWSISIEDIAADRELDPAALRAMLEAGPKSPDAAKTLGLVDKLGWPEEAADAAKARGDEAELLDIAYYSPPGVDGSAPVIALVGGEGPIMGGASGGDFFDLNSDPVFASDTVSAALLAAAEDEDVEAVVFRVDSGGGSAIASDQIWRAVERVQESGKPVVVSMGTVAASGGYYVAMGADAILAS
ncbi:MAG: S49 family peptidase, partial [Pseudomonadota bacterium]